MPPRKVTPSSSRVPTRKVEVVITTKPPSRQKTSTASASHVDNAMAPVIVAPSALAGVSLDFAGLLDDFDDVPNVVEDSTGVTDIIIDSSQPLEKSLTPPPPSQPREWGLPPPPPSQTQEITPAPPPPSQPRETTPAPPPSSQLRDRLRASPPVPTVEDIEQVESGKKIAGGQEAEIIGDEDHVMEMEAAGSPQNIDLSFDAKMSTPIGHALSSSPGFLIKDSILDWMSESDDSLNFEGAAEELRSIAATWDGHARRLRRLAAYLDAYTEASSSHVE
ncbi:hypothetical protein BC834DRAFT_916093 [Gloeopeniophorella convolvens]|nr:hypothetical protein BC834DRAFT_916093 [Gloeopeniophorella convolvens]